MTINANTGANLHKFSVLMSVYAGEKAAFFERSMRSIFLQTMPANEFVLVCDGPLTAELEHVIDKYTLDYASALKIVRLPKNYGLATALNYGLTYCSYDIIARMDSDDIATPNRFKFQLKAIENFDIVGCIVKEFNKKIGDGNSLRVTPKHQKDILKFARRRNPFNHPSVMFRKKIVQDVGGYEHFPLCEDYQLWVKILMNGAKAYNIQKALVHMRTGDGLYRRRGGYAYFKDMIKFRIWMRKIGFSSMLDFIYSITGHALSCFMPITVRKFIYKVYFRN